MCALSTAHPPSLAEPRLLLPSLGVAETTAASMEKTEPTHAEHPFNNPVYCGASRTSRHPSPCMHGTPEAVRVSTHKQRKRSTAVSWSCEGSPLSWARSRGPSLALLRLSPDCDSDWTTSRYCQYSAAASQRPVLDRSLSCHVQVCAGGCCSAAGTFCYRPGSGFSAGTADRPAPAAAAFGASGPGAAPPAPATYTPECGKDQGEPKQAGKTDVEEVSFYISATIAEAGSRLGSYSRSPAL